MKFALLFAGAVCVTAPGGWTTPSAGSDDSAHSATFIGRHMPGSSVPAQEYGPGSHIHTLASFAIDELQTRHCAVLNSFACSRLLGAEFQEIGQASVQVVAGMNYAIQAKTTAGVLHLEVFEQLWSNTLVIKKADFVEMGEESQLAVLEEEFTLDADKLQQYSLLHRHGQAPQPNLGENGHGQAPQPNLGENGHGQAPQPNLGENGHGQAPQPNLGENGHGQAPQPNLGENGHGQAPQEAINPIRTRMSSLLLGGVPLGNYNSTTLGGHYMGSDTAPQVEAADPIPEQEPVSLMETPASVMFHDNRGAIQLKEHPPLPGFIFAILGVVLASCICGTGYCCHRACCREKASDEELLTTSTASKSDAKELKELEAQPQADHADKWAEE